jgi:uncharacterized protein
MHEPRPTRELDALPAPPAKPVAPSERIEVVDVLRGVALCGILTVNMRLFNMPWVYFWVEQPWWPELHNRLATWAVKALAEGKFFPLFSLLFGFGMALQMQRIESRGGRFVRLYVRRLLALLIFGLCHVAFLWWGDILVPYAVLGFLLLLFRKLPPKALLILALAVYALTPLGPGMYTIEYEQQLLDPNYVLHLVEEQAADQEWWISQTVKHIDIYSAGSFRDISRMRGEEYADSFVALLFMFPSIFAMFLTGMYVARRGILHEPAAHVRLLRALVFVAFPSGLLLNLAWVISSELIHPAYASWQGLVSYSLHLLGAPLLTFGYAAAIVLLWQRGSHRTWLRPFAPLGRMALTNYIMHSIVCTTIFYGYGLGYYGQTSPAAGLALALAILVLQLLLSNWWLRLSRFGPLEWLWRCMTYAEWQPILIRREGLPPPTQGLIT